MLQPVFSGQHPLSPRVVHLALQYLTHALDLKDSYKLLKPHVEGLLVQVRQVGVDFMFFCLGACSQTTAPAAAAAEVLVMRVHAVKQQQQQWQQQLRRLAGSRCSVRRSWVEGGMVPSLLKCTAATCLYCKDAVQRTQYNVL